GVTLHPALRSPDFPLCRRELPAHSGCLADSRTRFYPARAQEYAFSMRRRLYFLLPDVESARHTADDLLLARVEDRHMHFLARRGTDLGELHEASYLFKTDLLHDAGAMQQVGLEQVTRLVQLAQVGAAPGEKVHVAVLDAREEQVVRGVPCAFHIGQQKIQPSSHRESILLRPRGVKSRPGVGQAAADRRYFAAAQRKVRAPQSGMQ